MFRPAGVRWLPFRSAVFAVKAVDLVIVGRLLQKVEFSRRLEEAPTVDQAL